jgi:hypothetical protein
VTAAALLDGNESNGEISWLHDDGTACSDRCTRMRVLSPAAHVEFGLAGALGFTGADVQRSAQVQVMSELPPLIDTLPFWLPSGCGYGPTEADTAQGGNGGPSASPTGTATTAPAPVTPTPVDQDQQIFGSSPLEVGYGGVLQINDYGITPAQNKATLRAFPPTGDAYVDFSAAPDNKTGRAPSFNVGTELSDTPGDWSVYAVVKSGNTEMYSANHLTITVTGGPPTQSPSPSPTATETGVPTGCVGQDRGNFGQLDSPRADESNAQKALALNVALGPDHRLVPYVFPSSSTVSKECAADGDPAGAQLDDVGGRTGDGANCIRGDTGNDGPKTYDGLIGGGAGHPGRLDVANGRTTCPGRTDQSVDGHTINDDTLACFLRGDGTTLADLAQPTGVTQSMLDPAVVKSPRFVWPPVVYATDRAQKRFQPILQFVPGFITEETQTSGPNDATGHVNGLDVNGYSVSVLHVFTFNRAALPPDEHAETVDYDDDLGGAIVRLVG